MLGLTPERVPRFVKMYESFYERGVQAMRSYADEVRSGAFPSAAHSFGAQQVPAAAAAALPAGRWRSQQRRPGALMAAGDRDSP